MRIFIALFFVAFTAAAQSPEVPHKMQFAGMTLTLRDDARREIQKDVNALTQSPRHHMIKVERARTYFPVIEKVLEEERVPNDFKYLVLQESALIADAVSVSNAVGFWQFKDYTAMEMGLRVDKEVDERLNIVSSTRAAARYIKKNNFYFNNWMYALQAYQMGAGGVMKAVSQHESGAKNMEVTSSTYWYVKKFLAHKIAFESTVGEAGQIKVVPYEINKSQRMLNDVAKEVSVSETELAEYNKWAKKGAIPADRMYTVMIPMKGDGREIVIPTSQAPIASNTPKADPSKSTASPIKSRTKINGISALKAEAGESPAVFAKRAGVEVGHFLKWNDLSSGDRLDPNGYYLLGKKRARASESYHKVTTDDNLWKISQQYGIQIKKLKRYNRISSDRDLKPGTTLWLTSMKPRDADKEPASSNVLLVDNSKSFSWGADPEAAMADISSDPVITKVTPARVEEKPVTQPEVKSVVVTAPETQSAPVKSTPAPVATAPKVETAAATRTPVLDAKSPASDLNPAGTPRDSVGSAKVTPSSAPTSGKKDHVIQTGETLYGIARMHNVAVLDLVTWNNLNLQEGIKPGQVLKVADTHAVTASSVVEPQTVTEVEHVVKASDTLYSVARKYNVTIKELMSWNDKKDFNLSVGEKLKVRTK